MSSIEQRVKFRERISKVKSISLLQVVLERLILAAITIWTGVTIAFIVTRLSPRSPAEQLLSRIQAAGVFMRPEEIEATRKVITSLFGLDKPIFEQYLSFLESVLSFRFGPSLLNFPVPANNIIFLYMPWTIFLLLTSTIISWIIGVILGIVMGMWDNKKAIKTLEYAFIAIFPLPYVVLAIALLIIFVGVLRVYIGVSVVPAMTFSLQTLSAMLSSAWVPALSLIILSTVNWAVGSYALAKTAKKEPHVSYATIRGIPPFTLLWRYIGKNVLILQVTALALSLGNIFSGALVTELIFNYPGLGTLLYQSIVTNDFNTMIGITTYSVIGVTLASLIIDLAYPFIDPRTKYGSAGE